MRMWMVPTDIMCTKHLLGEHVELHMFYGTIRKRKQIHGYVKNNLFEFRSLTSRHDDLQNEIIKRGFKHNSELQNIQDSEIENLLSRDEINYKIDRNKSLSDLVSRCSVCRDRYLKKLSVSLKALC